MGNAQSKLFIGVVSDLWDEPNNWFPNGVPTANDSVLIAGSSSVEIPPGYVASARYLDIDDAASLLIDNNLVPPGFGELMIAGSEANGVTSRGLIRNRGVPNISGAADHAIDNNGIIHNGILGEIFIDSAGIYGIENNDSMHNQDLIEIKNIHGPQSIGLFNWGSFLNEGIMIIDSISLNGLVTLDWFENRDTICIQHFNMLELGANAGLDVSAGSILNAITGYLLVADGQVAAPGVFNRAEIVNRGFLHIARLVNTGFSHRTDASTTLNEGTILIDDVTSSGVHISNNSSFVQLPSGQTQIMNVVGDWIIVDLGSTFEIEGDFDVN
ncbi:MAG: hypothetical protein OEM26_15520 [Saprospiraceae bacterium]|nr:hypothetical protein [Saprospiraceae bacterium]